MDITPNSFNLELGWFYSTIKEMRKKKGAPSPYPTFRQDAPKKNRLSSPHIEVFQFVPDRNLKVNKWTFGDLNPGPFTHTAFG